MALAPGFGSCVLAVARRLLLQAAVGHRPHVELDEGEQVTPLGVEDFDQRVGSDRTLLSAGPVGKWLARLALASEAGEPRPIGELPRERHIELAEAGGVREEERVGLAALAAARRR